METMEPSIPTDSGNFHVLAWKPPLKSMEVTLLPPTCMGTSMDANVLPPTYMEVSMEVN